MSTSNKTKNEIPLFTANDSFSILEDVNGIIIKIDSLIDSLKNVDSETVTTINAIKSSIEDVKKEITKIQTDTNTSETTINKINTSIETINASISQLNTVCDSLTTQISATRSDVTTLNTNVKNFKKDSDIAHANIRQNLFVNQFKRYSFGLKGGLLGTGGITLTNKSTLDDEFIKYTEDAHAIYLKKTGVWLITVRLDRNDGTNSEAYATLVTKEKSEDDWYTWHTHGYLPNKFIYGQLTSTILYICDKPILIGTQIKTKSGSCTVTGGNISLHYMGDKIDLLEAVDNWKGSNVSLDNDIDTSELFDSSTILGN